MTSPQRVAWVEQKFAVHGVEKVIPPAEVARATLSERISDTIAQQLREEALRSQEAWIDQRIQERLDNIDLPTNIGSKVARYFKSHSADRRTDAIDDVILGL